MHFVESSRKYSSITSSYVPAYFCESVETLLEDRFCMEYFLMCDGDTSSVNLLAVPFTHRVNLIHTSAVTEVHERGKQHKIMPNLMAGKETIKM